MIGSENHTGGTFVEKIKAAVWSLHDSFCPSSGSGILSVNLAYLSSLWGGVHNYADQIEPDMETPPLAS
jgi:hypothetical protein